MFEENSIHPILKVLFEGVYSQDNPLKALKGTPHIIRIIWRYVKFYNPIYWKSLIKVGHDPLNPNGMTRFSYETALDPILIGVPQNKFVVEGIKMFFPESQNLNIDMMPFVMGRHFEDCFLPESCYGYWKNLIQPLYRSDYRNIVEEEGKVCYLTIHESQKDCKSWNIVLDNVSTVVQEDISSSSRSGEAIDKGKGSSYARFYKVASDEEAFSKVNIVRGGVYIATNIENGCEIWNAKIQCDEKNNNREISERNGAMEHLKSYLGESIQMKANTFYWITDRTPHIIRKPRGYTRYNVIQYFRIVTHKISFWFADQSTWNPMGVMPDTNITQICTKA